MSIHERITCNALETQFEQALRSDLITNIDVSNCTSYLISRLLHKFAYKEAGDENSPISVRTLYKDRSYGNQFPLRCLPQRNKSYEPQLKSIAPLRVAMISMRHHDLDALVDYAWILNSDIPSKRSLAYVEEFSYIQTRQQLQTALNQECLKLHFYQTGYQPVVIGFYRAVIDELLARASQPPVLEVVPYHYAPLMGCYFHGTPWN